MGLIAVIRRILVLTAELARFGSFPPADSTERSERRGGGQIGAADQARGLIARHLFEEKFSNFAGR